MGGDGGAAARDHLGGVGEELGVGDQQEGGGGHVLHVAVTHLKQQPTCVQRYIQITSLKLKTC